MSAQNKYLNLLVYSVSHALVDASCVLLVLGGIDVRQDLLMYIVLYNVLAFGLQLPFGALMDKIKQPQYAAIIGLLLIGTALYFFKYALLAVVLVGMGNALFHVGGGIIALNLDPKKAALPGVFVSTGGLGLFAGGIIVKTFGFTPYVFIGALVFFALAMLLIKPPAINYKKEHVHKSSKPNYWLLAIVLILITIVIRSIVGLSLSFDWKNSSTIAFYLALSIALGKGLGGYIADALGWIKTTVIGLSLAALCIYFGLSMPIFGYAGIFLFNVTMPVTLVAVSNMLSGKPGFAFGLTTMALLLGSLPTFFATKAYFTNDFLLIGLIVLSSVLLFIGLKLYKRSLT